MPRIGLIGHVTEDVYPHGLEAGGCVTYAAQALAHLGCVARVYTSCHPNWVPPDLTNVIWHICESGETTRFENEFRADGTRAQRLLKQAALLGPGDFEFGALDHVHIVPVLDEVSLESWRPQLREWRRRGVTLSLGIQGLTRRARPGAPPREVRFSPHSLPLELLPEFDMIFSSDEDLAGFEPSVHQLAEATDLFFLTLGDHGSVVFRGGTAALQCPAFETDVVDPTGAGDTFAGAVVGALAMSHSLARAVERATASASFVVESRGLGIGPGSAEVSRRARAIRAVGPFVSSRQIVSSWAGS